MSRIIIEVDDKGCAVQTDSITLIELSTAMTTLIATFCSKLNIDPALLLNDPEFYASIQEIMDAALDVSDSD